MQWQFYPADAAWSVSVTPQLPAGLDAKRWQYKLLCIDTPLAGVTIEEPSAASVSITLGSQWVFYFQLVDTGA